MGIIIDDDGVIHKVFTKDEVVAILTDTQLEIDELKNKPHCCEHYVRGINNSSNVVQQKIDKIKENKKVMNKTEILDIVDNPSKHIHVVKIDGKDTIVYSSKFVDLLELIPTMLTKNDMVSILDKIRAELIQSIQNGTLKIESGNEELFRIIDKYKGINNWAQAEIFDLYALPIEKESEKHD